MADNVIQDIAVEQDKKKFVSDATERIYLLFNVQVTLSAPVSAGIQWVQLKGRKEDIENAKKSPLEGLRRPAGAFCTKKQWKRVTSASDEKVPCASSIRTSFGIYADC